MMEGKQSYFTDDANWIIEKSNEFVLTKLVLTKKDKRKT